MSCSTVSTFSTAAPSKAYSSWFSLMDCATSYSVCLSRLYFPLSNFSMLCPGMKASLLSRVSRNTIGSSNSDVWRWSNVSMD